MQGRQGRAGQGRAGQGRQGRAIIKKVCAYKCHRLEYELTVLCLPGSQRPRVTKIVTLPKYFSSLGVFDRLIVTLSYERGGNET